MQLQIKIWWQKYGRMGIQLYVWVENIVRKGEIARYEQFLLFLQCFQKQSIVDVLKWVSMEHRVKKPLRMYHYRQHVTCLTRCWKPVAKQPCVMQVMTQRKTAFWTFSNQVLVNLFLNDKSWTLPNSKSLQTTFSNLMKMTKVLKMGRKHCGKRRNCSLRAIFPFPTVFSKGLDCRHIKTRACLGKG